MSFFEKFPQFQFCCVIFDLRLGALAIGIWLILNNLGALITNLANGSASFFAYLMFIIALILGIYLTLGAYKASIKFKVKTRQTTIYKNVDEVSTYIDDD